MRRRRANVIMGVFVMIAWSTAIAGLASGFAAAQTAEGVAEVRVGAALPLSGPSALLGQEIRRGYELAEREINAAGGIRSLGGVPLRFIFADHRGIPDVAVSETERLIVREQVHVMVDAYMSGATYPATTVAERYGIPYLVTLSTMTDITKRGFQSVFRLVPTAEQFGEMLVAFIEDMNRQSAVQVHTIALVYESSGYGQDFAANVRKAARDTALRIVLDESYPSTSTDLTHLVLKMERANADAVIAASYISDAILLVQTMDALRVRPKAFFGSGAGYASAEFVAAVGVLSDYTLVADYWASDLPGEGQARAREAFREAYGKEMNLFMVTPYRGAYVLKDILENAGSLNREDLLNAFRATRIEDPTRTHRGLLLPMVDDMIAFGSDGQAETAMVVVMQIVDGVWRTVWPPEWAPEGNEPAWPSPRWEEK